MAFVGSNLFPGAGASGGLPGTPGTAPFSSAPVPSLNPLSGNFGPAGGPGNVFVPGGNNPFSGIPNLNTTFSSPASAPGGTQPGTGPGGTPASGTSWVPPAGTQQPAYNPVKTGVQGMGNEVAMMPGLSDFLQKDLFTYTNDPWAAEHGTAPTDISGILRQEAQNYLQMYPGTGAPSDIDALVNKFAGQYSGWLRDYNSYLSNNGQNIAGLAPSVAALAKQPAAPGTPGGPLATNSSGVTDVNQLAFSPTAAAGSPAASPSLLPSPANPSSNALGDPSGFSQMLMSMGNTIPQIGLSPDQVLANNSLNTNYLQAIAQGGGLPIDATPAWQAMVAQQQQGIDRGVQQLKEQFGASGNRFSTSFGTSLGDYMNQAILGQNSLLGQMTLQQQNDAMNRLLSASTTLGGFGQQGLSQLSSQGFQSQMMQQQQQLQAALAMLGQGGSAAQLMASLGGSAAGQLNNAAVGGANALFGAETGAGMQAAQNAFQAPQMLMSIGMQQYGLSQQQINNLYQEFLRTQPQYNPMLNLFSQGSNTYPNLFAPNFQPSQLGAILGGSGTLAGAIPGIIAAIKKLFPNDPSQSDNLLSQLGLSSGSFPSLSFGV